MDQSHSGSAGDVPLAPRSQAPRLGTHIRKALLCQHGEESESVILCPAVNLDQCYVDTNEAGASGIRVPKPEFWEQAFK